MIAIHPRAAGVTETGVVRTENEDSILVYDDASLWAVADGMGGHRNGKWASEQVSGALAGLTLTRDLDTDLARIGEAVQAANAGIVAESAAAGCVMGSTVAVLHLSGDKFAVFWAGDSRVYLYRGGRLHRLTTDHTRVQQMIDSGLLAPELAEDHPDKHILSRAVGVVPDLELDAVVDEAEPGDLFLLCSDGLTGVVSEAEIGERMDGASPKSAIDALLELALARGGPDNITIIAVACEAQTKTDGTEGI